MCGAIPIAVISGVLGVAGSYMQYQQAKTNVAYQNAQQNLQYQSSMLQAQSNRMTEDVKKQMNDDAIQHAKKYSWKKVSLGFEKLLISKNKH